MSIQLVRDETGRVLRRADAEEDIPDGPLGSVAARARADCHVLVRKTDGEIWVGHVDSEIPAGEILLMGHPAYLSMKRGELELT